MFLPLHRYMAPLPLQVSHELAFSFDSFSSNRNSWRFGVHISAFPSVSTGPVFSLIFISISHFNGDLEGKELDTCADITLLPRHPGLFF